MTTVVRFIGGRPVEAAIRRDGEAIVLSGAGWSLKLSMDPAEARKLASWLERYADDLDPSAREGGR
jgi:hypothetical protein